MRGCEQIPVKMVLLCSVFVHMLDCAMITLFSSRVLRALTNCSQNGTKVSFFFYNHLRSRGD